MKNSHHDKDKFALRLVTNVRAMKYSLYVQCFDKGHSFGSLPWRLLGTAFIKNGVL